MHFYTEEGGTPTPYMGDAHWRHLANTISHLNYLLRRRCGLMSAYFDHFLTVLLLVTCVVFMRISCFYYGTSTATAILLLLLLLLLLPLVLLYYYY